MRIRVDVFGSRTYYDDVGSVADVFSSANEKGQTPFDILTVRVVNKQAKPLAIVVIAPSDIVHLHKD